MPSGNFTLPLNHQHPLALIARGVGITLVLSLLETLDKQDAQNMPSVTLLYTNRNGHSHAFCERLNALRQRFSRLQAVDIYSDPPPPMISLAALSIMLAWWTSDIFVSSGGG